MGKQKLMFFLRQQPDAHLESTTRGEEYDRYKDSDYAFQVEKLFEQYKLERVSRMDWLDRVTLQRLEDISRELTAKESQVEEFSLSDQEAELRSSCTITIELPSFHFPVVHEDRTYGGVGGKRGILDVKNARSRLSNSPCCVAGVCSGRVSRPS